MLNKGKVVMKNIRKITDDLFYIGCSDRRIQLFESAYPVPDGVSYNSYLLKDEKTVLFDTVDKVCAGQFFENLDGALNGRKLDYLIVQHMEPDHASLIEDVKRRYPEVKIVCTAKAKDMIIKKDKQRQSYYNYYSSKKWGRADSYDLCINSSLLGIDGTVKLIIQVIEDFESK